MDDLNEDRTALYQAADEEILTSTASDEALEAAVDTGRRVYFSGWTNGGPCHSSPGC